MVFATGNNFGTAWPTIFFQNIKPGMKDYRLRFLQITTIAFFSTELNIQNFWPLFIIDDRARLDSYAY